MPPPSNTVAIHKSWDFFHEEYGHMRWNLYDLIPCMNLPYHSTPKSLVIWRTKIFPSYFIRFWNEYLGSQTSWHKKRSELERCRYRRVLQLWFRSFRWFKNWILKYEKFKHNFLWINDFKWKSYQLTTCTTLQVLQLFCCVSTQDHFKI